MLSLYSTPINTGFRASLGSKKATFQSKVGLVKCIKVFIRFNRIRRGVENKLSEVRRFPDSDATLVLLVNAGNNGAIGGLFDRLWDEAMQTSLDGL